MKQFNAFKTILLVTLLAATSTVQGQNRHPRAFGTYSGAYNNSNYYKDYVGLNVLTTAPSSLAGVVLSTFAGSGTTPWGGTVPFPLVNVPVVEPPLSDSCACGGALAAHSMDGKIALVWRGPISAPCEFGYKALQVQGAGAIACIIINEYPNQGPVGMAGGASGAGVTIPVFQIGNVPGSALDAAYDAGTPITMTISPWGIDTNNDLGFVPGGAAGWHDYAIPADQITSPSPNPYLGIDGAFVANYGKHNATHVSLTATLKFNGSTVHTSTTDTLALFTGTAAVAPDSIWSMFSRSTYDVTASAPGRFDLSYTINSDSTDQNPADNTVTNTFYASDSVYSKGTYDFTRNVPLSSFATAPLAGVAPGSPTDFVWGNMYFVNKGGAGISSVQYSASNSGTTTGPIAAGPSPVFIFKWTDGSHGQPLDGVIEDGEFDIVSAGAYAYNGTTDTSGVVFKLLNPGFIDAGGGHGLADSNGVYQGPILLTDTSWYYVAVNLPSSLLMECDGQSDPYPRIYGRFFHPNDTTFDYSSLVYTNDYTGPGTLSSNPSFVNSPAPFGGEHFITSVDSMNYNQMKGLIPSVALIVNKTPTYNHVGVKNVAGTADLNIYPNPTAENLTVSLNLENRAKSVTYSILDGLARFVSKEEHTNVLNEKTSLSTSKLASGTYFLIVNIDGRIMTRRFAVVK